MKTELDSFEAPDSNSVTTITTDEVTAICPFEYGSGRDFYTLTIKYKPKTLAVETKSLRDWIRSRDSAKLSVEEYAHDIYSAINTEITPSELYVRLEQNTRGGLQHTEEVGDCDLR